MELCTITLVSGSGLANTRIDRTMNVMQWQVMGQSLDAAFTIKGNATVNNPSGVPFTNVAAPLAAGQGYNSAQAVPQAPWDGVEIICTAGTVDLFLTTE